MAGYFEPASDLPADVRDISRALNTLREEVEAVDNYLQRVAISTDPEIKSIMAHNMEEEIEHAVLAIEWLRRKIPAWDRELRQYLFTEGDLAHMESGGGESASDPAGKQSDTAGSDLGIGSLKK